MLIAYTFAFKCALDCTRKNLNKSLFASLSKRENMVTSLFVNGLSRKWIFALDKFFRLAFLQQFASPSSTQFSQTKNVTKRGNSQKN